MNEEELISLSKSELILILDYIHPDRQVTLAQYSSNIEIIKLFAQSTDREVRVGVAKNKNISKELSHLLANDTYWLVRCNIAERSYDQELLRYLSKDKDDLIKGYVGENKNSPPDLLQELSLNPNWKVRAAVANNPSAPPKILNLLSKDRHSVVRHYVAYNTNTAPKTLKYLTKDENEYVRAEALKNKNLGLYHLS